MRDAIDPPHAAPTSAVASEALTYGLVRVARGHQVPAARLGDRIVDLAALAAANELAVIPDSEHVFGQGRLNPFMALGRAACRACGDRVREIVADGGARLEAVTIPAADAMPLLPFDIADYVDFYASRQHASNVGRILRPTQPPLRRNWVHIPIGYHGRAGTIVPSGATVRRPYGQRVAPTDNGDEPRPQFEPTRALDFELELGFAIGAPSLPGSPAGRATALDHVFGVVLLNDWSARDIQAWEAEPLGPFLGKAFATSISAWITPLDELLPRRIELPLQSPSPLEYIGQAAWGFDLPLEALLQTDDTSEPEVITRTNARDLYWNIEQMIVHLTAGGAHLRTGDLLGTGTISGTEPGSFGSLIELTWGGTKPIRLNSGAERTFLEDGDTLILRGAGLAECRSRVTPAQYAVHTPA
jgi:fumarylacetoacetase